MIHNLQISYEVYDSHPQRCYVCLGSFKTRSEAEDWKALLKAENHLTICIYRIYTDSLGRRRMFLPKELDE